MIIAFYAKYRLPQSVIDVLRTALSVIAFMSDIIYWAMNTSFAAAIFTQLAYLNMSRNAHVEEPRHPSNPTEDCRAVFGSPTFQQAMIQASPAIAGMVHLSETAVRVHAFQKRELESCHGVL